MALDMQAFLYGSFLEPGSPLVTGQGCPTNWGVALLLSSCPVVRRWLQMTLRWTCSVGPGAGGWEANCSPSLCVLSSSAVGVSRRPGFGWPRLGEGTFKKGRPAGPYWGGPKGHRSQASLGGRRLSGFQSQLSVCSSVRSAAALQDRPPWPAI